jgi:hypothetical protein
MTDSSPSEGTPPPRLQFDHAEFPAGAPTGLTCGVCKEPVVGTYFQINELTACPRCSQAVEGFLAGGSPLARFAVATLKGGAAALLGAALAGAIQRFSPLGLDIIAPILIGIAVGKAVRDGSMGRGGWFYQLLAVGLTYIGVAMSYLPLVYHEGHFLASLLVALASPFLAAYLGNYFILIGCGYGFYQAWQLNYQLKYEISGPWQLGTLPTAEAVSP